ncbi:hypothetical protein J7384_01310 [Endozoicomonas sp. G2_1]|uniref:hypothetical protein n=1 Tax=Endozoicomonas sp. G2_1 TaxID=2821091 RepID=UPI001ADA2F02|nr:hypothetical protein [Endozoicomonas sp. G2_1]MBO9488989.1 hypothetical protein [Endozoicomonas sp. G2_1]
MLSINRAWFIFILLKIVYMLLAIFVYSKFTQLGDTYTYLAGGQEFSLETFFHSTKLMVFVAGNLSYILGGVLANLPFLILAVYGVYLPIKKLNLSQQQLIVLLFFLSFPSYSIWTSIASKEAVTVFFLGGLLSCFIDYSRSNKVVNKFLLVLCLYLAVVFKPQYILVIAFIFQFVFICRAFRFEPLGKTVYFALNVLLVFFILYFFKDKINELSFILPLHFDSDGGSTRVNDIWVRDYDFFYNAPYGMFVAFYGPTLVEAISKPAHFLVWFESAIILLFFIYFMIKIMCQFFVNKKINIYKVSLFLIVFIGFLFVHYPFGALNYGSAIRYREGFYPFLVIWLFYLSFCRSNYIKVFRGRS